MKQSLFIKGIFLFSVVLFLSTTLFIESPFAQSKPKQYFQLTYIKVKPGKQNEYLKLEKEINKLIQQEQIRMGRSGGWELYEVLYPSGSSSAYDYVSICRSRGWSSIEPMRRGVSDIAKKVLSKEQLAIFERADQLRDITAIEIWEVEDAFTKSTASPPRYHVANFMKVTEGKWEEYLSMEKQLVRPIHEEHMKIGGRAGWGLYIMRQPGGAEVPYQAATFDFYDRWENMEDLNVANLWVQIHPGKSPEYIDRQITTSRTLLRQELRALVDYLQ